MLDRWLQSPGAAIGFIFFVIMLAGIYLVNRERAQVQRMRGPRRFTPKWKEHGGVRRKRRRRRTGGFNPVWTERETPSGSERKESRGEDESDPEDTSSTG